MTLKKKLSTFYAVKKDSDSINLFSIPYICDELDDHVPKCMRHANELRGEKKKCKSQNIRSSYRNDYNNSLDQKL